MLYYYHITHTHTHKHTVAYCSRPSPIPTTPPSTLALLPHLRLECDDPPRRPHEAREGHAEGAYVGPHVHDRVPGAKEGAEELHLVLAPLAVAVEGAAHPGVLVEDEELAVPRGDEAAARREAVQRRVGGRRVGGRGFGGRGVVGGRGVAATAASGHAREGGGEEGATGGEENEEEGGGQGDADGW